MRGKLVRNAVFVPPIRITPADAGKTSISCSKTLRYEDHPRGCGENSAFMVEDELPVGSPPRMRGKRIIAPYNGRYGRITPADAGKTA